MGDAFLVLLGLLALLEFLAVPILFVLVLSDRSRTAHRLEVLARRLISLEGRLAQPAPGAVPVQAPTAAPAAAAPAAEAPSPVPAEPAAPIAAAPIAPEPTPAVEPMAPVPVAAPLPTTAEGPPAEPPPAQVTPVPASALPPPAKASLEERVMRTWIVWLGGVALSLGAAFLVKYSVDQGWFGPVARVLAGAVLGFALWTAAEVVRRRDLRTPVAFVGRPDISRRYWRPRARSRSLPASMAPTRSMT